MPVVAENLIMGPALLYIGDFGVTEPADTAIGTPPGAGWVDMGGTLGGINLVIDQTYTPLLVDQVVDDVGSRRTARVMRFTTQLAEATLDNLARILNQVLPTPGAGFNKLSPTNDNSATQPLYKALLMDGWAPSGLMRRIIGRRMLNVSSVSAPYSKDGQTVYAAEFKSHYVSSSIVPFVVIDDIAA